MSPANPTPPVSCDDAWCAVAGDDRAHLFPVGMTRPLCGVNRNRGEKASAVTFGPGNRPNPAYRPYCPACLAAQEERWARAYPPPSAGGGK